MMRKVVEVPVPQHVAQVMVEEAGTSIRTRDAAAPMANRLTLLSNTAMLTNDDGGHRSQDTGTSIAHPSIHDGDMTANGANNGIGIGNNGSMMHPAVLAGTPPEPRRSHEVSPVQIQRTVTSPTGEEAATGELPQLPHIPLPPDQVQRENTPPPNHHHYGYVQPPRPNNSPPGYQYHHMRTADLNHVNHVNHRVPQYSATPVYHSGTPLPLNSPGTSGHANARYGYDFSSHFQPPVHSPQPFGYSKGDSAPAQNGPSQAYSGSFANSHHVRAHPHHTIQPRTSSEPRNAPPAYTFHHVQPGQQPAQPQGQMQPQVQSHVQSQVQPHLQAKPQQPHHNQVEVQEDGEESKTQCHDELINENKHLREQVKSKDEMLSSMQQRLNAMELEINELRQLPTGKISHIPVHDMIRIMEEFGSEVSNQTLPRRKHDIKKASVIRQFRRWNPEFFRYFVHLNGEWVPKLGKDGEIRRREEKRAMIKHNMAA